jgi:glycolate oxidase iron-sulfur subunit
LRWVLARILPHPMRFRVALLGAKIGRPFAFLMPDARLRAMLDMAPKDIPPVSRNDDPQTFPAAGPRRKRVALMTGCAQRALNTDINDATIRLLQRHGCDVVIAEGQGCCGALTHHMGKEKESHATAARNIRAWVAEMDRGGLDAIVINTSGCGTTVKDYGHMFRNTDLAGIGHCQGRVRGADDPGSAQGRGQGPDSRLSRRLFLAARPADQDLPQGSAETRGLYRGRTGGQPSVLWVGRDV